ncbi:MAG: ATP-binding cassette domain-containing protein [Marinobacter sp.]|uniref:ATP-binding cassette domain-containing protein n=1 Tax=Marinobacter sp. TaxID=50741 RepID=UPI003298C33B
MTAVALQQLGKSYAGTPILSDLTTTFPADTVTAIIGRSGSGKSTLLRMVNGLVQPDIGVLQVLGQPIDYQALPALRQRIGYAVQGNGLFPHLSVEANICLLARLQEWEGAQIQQRLQVLLDMVQLPAALLGRFPYELSGGQQQRVGLARALMLNPPLLLLDEPFAALDPLTRLDIHQQLLQMQAREPRCVLLVTHDMREAMKLGDSILVLERGHMILREEAAALRDRFPQLEPEQLLLNLLEQGS